MVVALSPSNSRATASGSSLTMYDLRRGMLLDKPGATQREKQHDDYV